MRKLTCLLVLLLAAGSCFADTTYNNFTGYSDYWHPLGNPKTSTYGETFTAPATDTSLQTLKFYMGSPYVAGDIKLAAYVASWTGTNAGTLLWSSPMVDYDNAGDEVLSFNVGGLNLDSNGSYVAFLSVSQFYGESSGEAYVSQGDGSIPGSGTAIGTGLSLR